MLTIIVVAFVLIALSLAAKSLRKSGQNLKRHIRCEICDSRLKVAKGHYATRCRECGEVQSWSLKELVGPCGQERSLSDLVVGERREKLN